MQDAGIFGPQTDVIVNTISEDMNLKQGAVSKAILEAAGPQLQSAVRSEAGVATLQQSDVVITDGFKLSCRKVFHAVCPFWDNGGGRAEEVRAFTHRSKDFPDRDSGVILKSRATEYTSRIHLKACSTEK